MELYWTYVRRSVYDPDFHGEVLNGEYDPSFFLNYPGYSVPWIDRVEDGDSLAPANGGRRLIRVTHSLTPEQIKAVKDSLPAEFAFVEVSPAQAAEFLRSYLPETSPGTFLAFPWFDIPGWRIPDKFVTVA